MRIQTSILSRTFAQLSITNLQFWHQETSHQMLCKHPLVLFFLSGPESNSLGASVTLTATPQAVSRYLLMGVFEIPSLRTTPPLLAHAWRGGITTPLPCQLTRWLRRATTKQISEKAATDYRRLLLPVSMPGSSTASCTPHWAGTRPRGIRNHGRLWVVSPGPLPPILQDFSLIKLKMGEAGELWTRVSMQLS
ncbi:hypothetical protein BGZ63DRAFT_212374 [Mariannaea sp. PMI_226]|nr:hypothetical protein BGZ63DRAFT_212374 [Mariannaea sp. PMI_226]